ncbi:MAG: glutamate racemase [Alphaproteobacteria bacterium]|jgi:glutamate racemase|nr:glutamate racemase [Alphaproteobacteria bacterium]MDP7222691.1 glutamate racemase [Alphaproteobacteria bacterium]
MADMKLGVFDSGLGGLLIAKAIEDNRPDIDMVYLGDTLHVPYGKRSKDAIYDYSRHAIDYLFSEKDCQIVLTACNTVSAAALRTLQQTYLPDAYPDRRILGVVVPTLEEAISSGYKNIGIIATEYIVESDIYAAELKKLDPSFTIHQQATPLLVPLIENNGLKWVKPILEDYLEPLLAAQVECLILGCTHYPHLMPVLRDILGDQFPILSQVDIIPYKLNDYLQRHPVFDEKIGKNGTKEYLVTDITRGYKETALSIYNKEIEIQHVKP